MITTLALLAFYLYVVGGFYYMKILSIGVPRYSPRWFWVISWCSWPVMGVLILIYMRLWPEGEDDA